MYTELLSKRNFFVFSNCGPQCIVCLQIATVEDNGMTFVMCFVVDTDSIIFSLMISPCVFVYVLLDDEKASSGNVNARFVVVLPLRFLHPLRG